MFHSVVKQIAGYHSEVAFRPQEYLSTDVQCPSGGGESVPLDFIVLQGTVQGTGSSSSNGLEI